MKRKVKSLLLLLCIFVCAGIFRLFSLSLVEFKGDEALNLFLATRFLFGHPFPPASLASSVGILNFPLLNYFLFPITVISSYPPFVSGAIALLNTIAVVCFFAVIRKYFSLTTALLSSLLLAFSPWAIIYSRKIWAQDFIIPLVVVLLFAFFKIYQEKKQWYWIVYMFFSLLLLQIHQTTGIVPILLAFALCRKEKPTWKFVGIGILLGTLPLIPYAWFEAINKCPDCTTFLSVQSRLQIFQPTIFQRIFQIVTAGDFHTLIGNADYGLFLSSFPLVEKMMKISYIIYLLLPISFFLFWRYQNEYRSFIIVTLGVVILFFLARIQPEMHYFIIFLPFLFLFVGYFFAKALESKKKVLIAPAALLFIFFITFYVCFDSAFFSLLQTKKGFGGSFGSTFFTAQHNAQKDLASFVRNPAYQEIRLAYFVPKESIFGSTPVGRMLYPVSSIKSSMPLYEKEIQSSSDPRIANAIIAYYTSPENANYPTFSYLQRRGQTSDFYFQLFQWSYQNYLTHVHKHAFTNSFVHGEYPEHWQIQQDEQRITLSDEYVIFTLTDAPSTIQPTADEVCTTIKIQVAGQPTQQHDCFYTNGVWKRSYLGPVTLGGHTVTIFYTKNSLYAGLFSTAQEKGERAVLDSITSSLSLPF